MKRGPVIAAVLILGLGHAGTSHARLGLNASDFADDAARLAQPDSKKPSASKALGPQICESEAELTAGTQIDGFCAHPYETICRSDSEAMRSARFETLREKIRASASQDLKAAYQALDQEIGVPSSTWKLRWRDKIQRQLIASIGSQPGLSSAQKKKLQEGMDKTEVIDGREILEGARPDLLPNLQKQCGQDGLKRNAFQPPGTNVVVLCPGLLAGAWFEHNDADIVSRLTFTLAHEIGHQIDADVFPVEYRKLRACMDAGFSSSFAAVAREPSALPTRHQELVDGYMEEISADIWGAETLAQDIAGTRLRSQAFYSLKRALGSLCGWQENDSHPSDRFRIDIIAGRNPRLRQALGCAPNPDTAPGCAIEGRVP